LRTFASLLGGLGLLVFLVPAPALAQVSSTAEPAEAPPPSGPPAPALYSIPWQLKAVVAATSIRLDTAAAFYEDTASRHGSTVASLLTASLRIPNTGPKTAGLVVFARGAMVEDTSPAGNSGFAIGNPLVGGGYSFNLAPEFRASIAFVATIPVGMGGGDNPDPGHLQARQAASPARSQIDGAIFAANDLFVGPLLDLAWVAHDVTLQLEADFYQFTRVRGAAVEGEATKTSTVLGFHAGYYFVRELSVGAELRYQRWLNPPFAVENDPTSWDQFTFAFGPRLHFRVAPQVWMHPGLAYARGLDKPMAAAAHNYHIVQLDIPIVF
jgi:hypothetical protein